MLGIGLEHLNNAVSSAELRKVFLTLLTSEPQTVREIKARLRAEHGVDKDSPNISNRLKNMCQSMPTVRCEKVETGSQQKIFAYWKVPLVEPKAGQIWVCNKTIVKYAKSGYPEKGDRITVSKLVNTTSKDTGLNPILVVMQDDKRDYWALPICDFSTYYRIVE